MTIYYLNQISTIEYSAQAQAFINDQKVLENITVAADTLGVSATAIAGILKKGDRFI